MSAFTMSRQLPTTNNNDRLGPVARPGASEEPSASMSLTQGLGSGTRGWADNAGSIWSNGLGSTTRDSSRSRDASAFLSTTTTATTTNGTSNSTFGQALTTDVWNKPKSAWDTTPRDRSSGVSPVRRNSRLLDGTDVFGQAAYRNGSRPSSNLFGNSTYTGQRHSEVGLNGTLGHYTRDSTGSAQQQGSISSWTEGGSVHSPTDDRRSAASDSYNPYSNPSSRNPSQPPSRHGNSDPFFGDSPFNRFGSARGHTPSVSSVSGGRYQAERQNSMSNDNLPVLERLSLNGEPLEQLVAFQRQSLDLQSPTESPGSLLNTNFLQTLQNNQAAVRGFPNFGSYTPDNGPTFNNPFSRQSYERGAFTPGANDFRQPSYVSNSSASDGSYPLPQNGRANQANPALLERRLRSIQQEQTNGYLPHAPLQSSALNPYRQPFTMNGFTPPYGLANTLPLNGINVPPHLAGYGQAGLYHMAESAPRARDDGMTLQSQLLTEFKATTSKGNRQWQLKEIQGHVVEFCGDQIGSRFIQTRLEQANSDDKQLVFAEILPDIIQLMQDVFGNYVIQKFFDHGDQTQKAQIAGAMKGHLFELSTQMYACRVVQKVIDHILTSQQGTLIREMEPHVIRCVKDMNGNHVIQKAIERIPGEHIQFIVDAFTGKVDELAKHTYGCRVIQRVLEHCTEPVKRTILTELHNSRNIIDDQFGNYVTQHMIEFGFAEDKEKVIGQVRARLIEFSTHKFASNVVEKCFAHGSEKQKHELLMTIVESGGNDGNGLMQLLKDGYGNYVIQKMLDSLSDSDWKILHDNLKPLVLHAKRTGTAGKHISAVEKKMGQRSHLIRSDSVHSPTHPQPGTGSTAATPNSVNTTTSPTSSLASPSHNSSNLPRINLQSPTINGQPPLMNGYGPSRQSIGS